MIQTFIQLPYAWYVHLFVCLPSDADAKQFLKRVPDNVVHPINLQYLLQHQGQRRKQLKVAVSGNRIFLADGW